MITTIWIAITTPRIEDARWIATVALEFVLFAFDNAAFTYWLITAVHTVGLAITFVCKWYTRP